MANLISNGARLYRYNNQLLRTPLIVNLSLAPIEAAQYDVAQHFTQQIPTRGFVGEAPHITYATKVGSYMRDTYLGFKQALGPIIWRSNNAFPNIDPGFIFYQGTYSTSTATNYPEAYMTLPAYRFEIPEKYDQFQVVGGTLNLMHGGTILQKNAAWTTQTNANYMPQFAANAANWLMNGFDEWRYPLPVNIGWFSDLYHPYNMNQDAIQTFDATTNDTQGYLNQGEYNAKEYWISWPGGQGVTYYDGCIPITTNPWVQQVPLDSNMLAAMNSNRVGWIPALIDVDSDGNDDNVSNYDYPVWVPSSSDQRAAGFWLCCNFWGFSLNVQLALV